LSIWLTGIRISPSTSLKTENVDLTDQHWEVINFLREYLKNTRSPGSSCADQGDRQKLGADKGNSEYLYGLFPYGPGKQACKIAGLPKPTGCV